jgi:hypothetical protein
MALGALTSLSRGDLGYMSGSLKFHHVEPRRFEVLDALRRSYVGRKMVPPPIQLLPSYGTIPNDIV